MARHVDALTVSTAVVLFVVTAFAGWAVVGLWDSSRQVQAASARVGAYQDLQASVAAQAFAEAGYRRAPSTVARLRMDAAVTEVDADLQVLHQVADPGEGAMLSYLRLLDHRYVDEALRTLDAPTAADDRVAGPALDGVQQLAQAAIDVNQRRADDAIATQRTLLLGVTTALPVVLLIAATSLGIGVRASRRVARQLRAAADNAHARSMTDALTGLANRTGFEAAWADATQHSTPTTTGLLMLDLDHFKGVNDRYGHEAGDAVLVEVSRRLREALRPGDVPARLGGDEFAVVLPACTDPTRVAERVRDAIAQPMLIQGAPFIPTVSVGAVTRPADAPRGLVPGAAGRPESAQAPCLSTEDDRSIALRAADAAAYEAKRSGRDQVRTAAWPNSPALPVRQVTRTEV